MCPTVSSDDQTTHLLQSLLEQTTHEPMVVVMVVDEGRQHLLDMRFEPVENIAALMRLQGKPIDRHRGNAND